MKYIYQFRNLILLVLLLIFFYNFFVPHYQKYIVDTFLIAFNKSKVSDVLILTIFLFSLYWTYSKLKVRYYLKSDYVIYSFIFLLLCIYIRNNYENQLLRTHFLHSIKYFDILFVFGMIPLILIVGFWFKNQNKNFEKSDFFHDNPVDNPDEDILNRRQKAFQVSRLIRGNKSKTSLAIGIVGEWGNGKTSFMNFVEKSFKDEDKYISIHFNSWLNISVNSIINDFFSTVEKQIRVHSIDVSKEIKRYGNSVLSVNKNLTTETLLNLISTIPDSSLSDDFNNLNNLLNKLDKKIIVFFDDLDRLQPNEVFEVLKLIRNTASFDIFNYVVGYDKEYLNKALEKNNIPFPEKYCEKIFLKEFPLPPITQEQINDFLKNNIIDILPENKVEIDKLFEYVNVNIFYNDESVLDSLKNIRNAKRFLNEFKISIEGVKSEVNLSDFFHIKLLKFSYYEVYRLLFNKDAYIESNDRNYSGVNKYIHYVLRKKEIGENNFVNYSQSFDSSILKMQLVSLNLFNDRDLKIIGAICEKLFQNPNQYFNTSPLSISCGNNYYKYFDDEISELAFIKSDFEKFLEGDYEVKRQIIDNAYNEDKLNGLLLFIFKIKIYNDIETKTAYQDFIKSLFYIANLKPINNNYYSYYGVDFAFMEGCMSNYKDALVKKFDYRDILELKDFYKSLFYSPKNHYDFEIDFIRDILERNGTNELLDIPFNKSEIEDYLYYCFDNDAKAITKIDKNFWHCYRLCFLMDLKQETSNSWRPIEKILERNKEKLLYEIIPMYLDEFLVSCVYPQSFYGEDEQSYKVGLHDKTILRLFGSYDEFINYLESEKLKELLPNNSEFSYEFLKFTKDFNDKKHYINFNFTYLPIVEKLKKINVR